jgi:hypothetical protein
MSEEESDVCRVELLGWEPSIEEFARRIRLDLCPDCREEALALFEAARCRVRPRAAWRAEPLVHRGDSLSIRGQAFTGRAIAEHIADIDLVYPYIASCSFEPAALHLPGSSALIDFWVDELKSIALDAAYSAVREVISQQSPDLHLHCLNPGMGDACFLPIENLKPLFSVLGKTAIGWVGVELTEDFFMRPAKSLSGIFFFCQEEFEICSYCGRPNCAFSMERGARTSD